MRKLILGAALISLAACASAPPSGPRTDWSCDRGAAFSVRFNGTTAEVFAGGQLYNLPAAQSGSGTLYSNGTVEYREHQGQATLTNAAGGPYTSCRR